MTTPTVWLNTLQKQGKDGRIFDLSFPGQLDFPTYWQMAKKYHDSEEDKQAYWDMNAKYLEVIHRCRDDHKALDPAILPDMMYSDTPIDPAIVLPGLFKINNGFLMMNEAFRAVLQRFRLGATQVSAVGFYDLARDAPVNDETYYFLNVCEWRNYFLPGQSGDSVDSRGYQRNGYDIYGMPDTKKENREYLFSRAALDCPLDLWHDPMLRSSLFMSDALVTALREAGFGPILSLLPCQLADPHPPTKA